MRAAIALVLGLAVFPVYGQLLKCIAKDGKVEYASQCPPGTQEVNTGIRSRSSAPAPAAAPQSKSLADREAEFRKRQAEQADAQSKQQKDAEESAQRKRACEEARNYLAGLEAGARVTRIDPKTGERVFLEDAERAAEVARAKGNVQANCK